MKKLVVPIPTTFKVGERFVATGVLPTCEECWLKEKCAQLKRGWIYEVVAKIGTIEHPCRLHGKVIVAEVKEIGVPLIVPSRLAIEGATIEYTPLFCPNKKCELWSECTGRKYRLGRRAKVKIVEILERINCPEGNSLVRIIGYLEESSLMGKKRDKKRDKRRRIPRT